jgi:hypothetical protein
MAELGQTHDPRALVPGDPAAVRDNVTVLRSRSEHAEKAADGLVNIDTGVWTGEAAEHFRDKFSYEPNKWYGAADALGAAADALGRYAEVLEWAQSQAGAAIQAWDDAEAYSRRARAAYDQAVAGAQPGQTVLPFVDPGDPGRQAAQDALSSARGQVATVGDTTARYLSQEADAAPEESSWLDDLGNFALDTGAGIVNDLASVGNALLNNPGDVINLAGGLALTALSGTGEGVGLVLDATGFGAVAGVPLNVISAAGVATGVTWAGVAAASIAEHAAGDDAVQPVSGSAPSRSTPTRTDRIKEHLTARDLDAARRELNGEVVARKPNGDPWDHVHEVKDAQNGLLRRIGQLKRLLGDGRVTAEERAGYESELSEASRLLDRSREFVPPGS